MAEPLAGAAHATAAVVLPAVAVGAAGVAGAVAGATGVTAALAGENPLVPTALIAATWKVYAVPLVSPVTFRLVPVAGRSAPACVAPENTRTVYPVIGEPPSAGAVQVTVADALPPVAVGAAGATGAVAGAATVSASALLATDTLPAASSALTV